MRRILLRLALAVLAGAPVPCVAGAAAAAPVYPSFRYTFNTEGVLHEAPRTSESASPYWWLSSGGTLTNRSFVGHTIRGELPSDSRWRREYAASSSWDTDQGYHPQNLFRLFTRSRWRSFRQEVYFMVRETNTSPSGRRNASNGVQLFSRYQDAESFYIGALRVDGGAVIKKKMNGQYWTLGFAQIFGNRGDYDRDVRPNVMPERVWLGVRLGTITRPDGSVRLVLHASRNGFAGPWEAIVDAVDTPSGADGPPILAFGRAGIRSDFMDVSFESYVARALE